jgi:hypothetical protein
MGFEFFIIEGLFYFTDFNIISHLLLILISYKFKMFFSNHIRQRKFVKNFFNYYYFKILIFLYFFYFSPLQFVM